MKTTERAAYWIDIFIAGDRAQAAQACRAFCWNMGLCVHVVDTDYIYTGGQEAGVKVGLVNYPRFPSTPDELWRRAEELGTVLMRELCQTSFLLQAPDRTVWFSRREETSVCSDSENRRCNTCLHAEDDEIEQLKDTGGNDAIDS